MNLFEVKKICFFEKVKQYNNINQVQINIFNILNFLIKDLEENYSKEIKNIINRNNIKNDHIDLEDFEEILHQIINKGINIEEHFSNLFLYYFLEQKQFKNPLLFEIQSYFKQNNLFQLIKKEEGLFILENYNLNNVNLRDLNKIFQYDETYHVITFLFKNYLEENISKFQKYEIEGDIFYSIENNKKYFEDFNSLGSQLYLQFIRHKNNFKIYFKDNYFQTDKNIFEEIMSKIIVFNFNLDTSIVLSSIFEKEKAKNILKNILSFKLMEYRKISNNLIDIKFEDNNFKIIINNQEFCFNYYYNNFIYILFVNLKSNSFPLKDNTFTFSGEVIYLLEENFISYIIENINAKYNNYVYRSELLDFFNKTKFEIEDLNEFRNFCDSKKKIVKQEIENITLEEINFDKTLPLQIKNNERLNIELNRQNEIILLFGDKKQTFNLIKRYENIHKINKEKCFYLLETNGNIIKEDFILKNLTDFEKNKDYYIYSFITKELFVLSIENVYNIINKIKDKYDITLKFIFNIQTDEEHKTQEVLKIFQNLSLNYNYSFFELEKYNIEELKLLISKHLEDYLALKDVNFNYILNFNKKYFIDNLLNVYKNLQDINSLDIIMFFERIMELIKIECKNYYFYKTYNHNKNIKSYYLSTTDIMIQNNNLFLKNEYIDYIIKSVYDLYKKNEKKFNQNIDEEALIHLQHNLNSQIFNQEEVIQKIIDKLYLFKSNLTENGIEKPIASFIFAGKTGTGKTELAKLIAKNLNLNFIRLDMSEYKLEHYQSNLLGSPVGYSGSNKKGMFLRELENNPYSVILFDEIEKAHSNIFELFLQILDYGILTDASTGQKIDFSKSIIIFTSNLGVEEEKHIGFHEIIDKFNNMKKNILKTLEAKFSPEFLARLDNVLIFKDLEENTYIKIIEKELNVIKNRLKEKNIDFNFEENTLKLFYQYLINKKFNIFNDNFLGAREIKNLIQQELSLPLSKILLTDTIKKHLKNNIVFTIDNNEINLNIF